MPKGFETEVKIPIPRAADALQRFHAAGLRLSVPRLFEANTLYDTPDQRLRRNAMILRLREAGDKFVLTWKGPGQPGPHKIREEIETTLGSRDAMHRIFVNLGYAPSFRYEKYRTEFLAAENPSPGVITLDETPIGDFLEIEGPGDWIDATARRLGFSPKEYVLESYGALYLAHCERLGVQPTNMVFASQS